jgi:carboxypeptidase Taq
LLRWDQETYMPPGAIDIRAEQMAILAGLRHERLTSETFRKALGAVVDLKTGDLLDGKLHPEEARFATQTYRHYRQAAALPADFVAAYAKLCAQSQHAWEAAKRTQNAVDYLPILQRVVDMTRRKAAYLNPNVDPYDALMDEYEPGLTAQDLMPLLAELRKGTIALLKKIQATEKEYPPIDGQYDLGVQAIYNQGLAQRVGFDFNHGRLDPSTHPFTIEMHPHDIRITTRYKVSDVSESISGTLHEAGHGLYEQGLPPQWFGTPFGWAASLGVHESQSRLWEIMIGKSKAFWEGEYPRLMVAFPELHAVPRDTFFATLNAVKPGFIRVEADELTYNLHILVRAEIEIAIINDRLKVRYLREAWNGRYRANLGIDPPDDGVGFLQDVHWSLGAFGYFPTYTLGNIYAAMLFDALGRDLPDRDALIRSGNFAPIVNWLSTKIYQQGARRPAKDLIEDICNRPVSVNVLLDAFKAKYGPLYNLKF